MENTSFKTLEIPEPWYWTNENLSDQLQIELNKDHILKGKIVKTVARRQDNDDILIHYSRLQNYIKTGKMYLKTEF
ncbi:hypothetical protein J2W57_002964 [Chryseobacterium ginsenosidimutans]|uniref:Uncharacterized protein n=1 Tax=Chryseobacterium geocarposphaerae TaxID=1416776 RepID=A0ABU1LHG4_9FLAO|nr:hypothetical protein [Chryseobacterium geocarposphaerae]MDR6699565.1 hypothetical protein [Chryseobacterium ginsenosidimutans]